jgi:hypothetical protein
LLGVAFAGRADQKDEFVGIPFRSDGAVDGVIAEAGSVSEKFLGLGAAIDEVVDGALWRSEAVGGLERIRSLNLGGTVRDAGQNAGVDHSDVAAGAAGATITFSTTMPRIESSAAAMCSMHSATDQRSGADLKFH